MKIGLYVTKDTVAGEATSQITMYKNEALAKRSWGNAIENIIATGNPEKVPVKDLQMFKIGEFDTETLEIVPCNEFIANGGEFVVEAPKNQK